MARKNKSTGSAQKRQQETAMRAQWRALEKMGLAKKRVRVDGKLPAVKLTSYKKRRLRELAPVLTGDAVPVRLGPKALKAARSNNLLRAGRYAIVAPGRENVERVRSGLKPRSSISRRSTQSYDSSSASSASFERAISTIIDISQGGKKPPNENGIRNRMSRHSAQAVRAIANAPKHARVTHSAFSDWWEWWCDEYDYDYPEADDPAFYH